MSKKLAFVLVLLVLGSCGDDCDECTMASQCPRLTKQCTGFTAEVQQCSGTEDKSCCATSAADISCSSLRAAEGSYSLDEGGVSFRGADRECGLDLRIDPVANGWVDGGAGAAEREAAVRRRMGEVLPKAVAR